MNTRDKRSSLLYFAYFFSISALLVGFGLSEVGWKWQALPVWFWWVILTGVLLGLISNVMAYHTSARPRWQRVVLLGLGWGIPIACSDLSRDALRGDLSFTDPLGVLLSTGPYLIMSLVFGAIIATTLPKK